MDTQQYDVLVVGELNVDIILNDIDGLPEVGKEKLARRMVTTLGSSSAIFASNLSSLGASVAFLGKIGTDAHGDLILDSLRSRNVDTTEVLRDEAVDTGATLVLNYHEDRAMVTYPGAMEQLTINDVSDQVLTQARHLHFSSYFLQPGLRPAVPELFRRAQALGLTTSLDPQWDPAEQWEFDVHAILPHVDVFLPNEKELLCLTRASSVDDALAILSDTARCVVVKKGNQGSYTWRDGQLHHQPPFLNESVVDAIGAGDSFNAGFIRRFVQGRPLEECQTFGNLTGALSTTQPGGTAAFRDTGRLIKLAQSKFNYALTL